MEKKMMDRKKERKKFKEWWKKERRSKERKREEGRMETKTEGRNDWKKRRVGEPVSDTAEERILFLFKGERVTAWDCQQKKKNYESWTMSELLKGIVIADVTSVFKQRLTDGRMDRFSCLDLRCVCAREYVRASLSLFPIFVLSSPLSLHYRWGMAMQVRAESTYVSSLDSAPAV